ncbi:MAG TPA: cysteine synthase family protein [Candidatus Korarchaeota archaeon]|nr:cysteine synthase family protein [Candidatus Korarchaeota archaeon]
MVRIHIVNNINNLSLHAVVKYATTILDLIGNTPLVRINKLNPNPNVEMYAKLEGLNPEGSVKDRICLRMIEEAEKDGSLTKDRVILEPTSGNTGIGLAMIAAVKGYRCLFTMPASVSIERMLMLKAFGAEIILTPPEKGTDGAIIKARELLESEPEKYFMPNQFDNPANPTAHYEGTGPEIWRDTDGRITHFIAGLGTSGTMMGAGRYLKKRKPSIQLIAVEPELGHKIQGLKNMQEAIVPKIFDRKVVDRTIVVSTKDAYEWALKLTKIEGIFVGQSSGAAMCAAHQIAEEVEKGVFVVIFPDLGFKYLTADPYRNEEVVEKILEARKTGKVVRI